MVQTTPIRPPPRPPVAPPQPAAAPAAPSPVAGPVTRAAETAGNIAIWINPPGTITDVGPATAPGNFTVTGTLALTTASPTTGFTPAGNAIPSWSFVEAKINEMSTGPGGGIPATGGTFTGPVSFDSPVKFDGGIGISAATGDIAMSSGLTVGGSATAAHRRLTVWGGIETLGSDADLALDSMTDPSTSSAQHPSRWDVWASGSTAGDANPQTRRRLEFAPQGPAQIQTAPAVSLQAGDPRLTIYADAKVQFYNDVYIGPANEPTGDFPTGVGHRDQYLLMVEGTIMCTGGTGGLALFSEQVLPPRPNSPRFDIYAYGQGATERIIIEHSADTTKAITLYRDGRMAVGAAPTQANDVATKDYVDNLLSRSASFVSALDARYARRT